MIEIIPANKKHIASIEALAKRRPKKNSYKDSPILYYLACTVLKNYSFVALEAGELVGYILSFQATAQNYVWLQEVFVHPEKHGRKLYNQLLHALESHLKGIWTTPVKSIKVALQTDNYLEKDFYESHRFKFTRSDDALGKEIYQKRVIA